MKAELRRPDFHCRYQLIDIRTLDEEALLASPFASDNIIAILAKQQTPPRDHPAHTDENRYTRWYGARSCLQEVDNSGGIAETWQFHS